MLDPLESEGAGKAGCALHPRSRVQNAQTKRTRAYRFSGGIRLSLRSGLRLIRALPGDQDLLVTVVSACWRELDANHEASGPHDFAVRLGIARLARRRVHRTPPRVRDVRETPLRVERDTMGID